eukprot:CAMPEP_0203797232 /NCGR_PEP_ID=MMETSP0100_2-20121128/8498_1 /ASSEMBLY_ACC=CAM_ASM_000210 /TAXON_ID=96639 /ORGANISM=" , Strain NY0313808BC1" /LENGTH=77 /DNA_ID=CAMNT_0050702483 /DNA_START=377 /DNA_END=606 /DNA_ORIENTATION=+
MTLQEADVLKITGHDDDFEVRLRAFGHIMRMALIQNFEMHRAESRRQLSLDGLTDRTERALHAHVCVNAPQHLATKP